MIEALRALVSERSEEPDTPSASGDGRVIDARDVAVTLGDTRALDGVSLELDRGRFLGVVGPNGAGKTTLLRTIAGLLRPDAGRVTVAGDDVHALGSRAASRRVAVVPQDASIAFDFPVREVVAMGRTPYTSRLTGPDRASPDAVDRAMDRTAVTDLADRAISAVSGGERQRVLLARALAQDTPVLLLDEPTASLDINHQVRTLELVRSLVADGRSVVAAIHDLNLAAHYCDDLLLLADGREVAHGDPSAVLTADRLEAAFDTRAAVTRHPVTGSVYVAALPDHRPRDPAGRVHVIGGGGTAGRLLYVLTAAGFDVSTGALNRGDADLETARSLGLEYVDVPPFSPVDDAAGDDVAALIDAADVTVIADVEVGAGNLANLEAAAASDRLVLVEERAFTDRNYAGDDAARVYASLRERARVVAPDGVLAAVSDAVDADTA